VQPKRTKPQKYTLIRSIILEAWSLVKYPLGEREWGEIVLFVNEKIDKNNRNFFLSG
jgi:hypothetical protein